MFKTIKTILKPLASLRLTVVLLALSMFLVYAGTWAQVSVSIWDVQRRYFYSTLVWIPLKTLFTRVNNDASAFSSLKIPFPGGYVLGLLLLINLLAAHTVRFKLSWKRSGIFMIHIGLIMLLVGEGISSRMKVENRMRVVQGSYAKFVYDDREGELVVIDPSPADHDNVTVVPAPRLKKGGIVEDAAIPFKLRIDAFYENTHLTNMDEKEPGPHATAGASRESAIDGRGIARSAGTGDNAMDTDYPSAYVTPIVDGKPAGTFLLSAWDASENLSINQPEPIEVNGKKYLLQLRFKRTYEPFTITLNKFTFDKYPGTDTPRNYASDIRLVDPEKHEDRLIHVWMNHPLRYRNETLYQSGFDQRNGNVATILQVVRNPAWTLPYISCAVGGLGLLVHFGILLFNFVEKQSRRTAPPPLPGIALGERPGARTDTGRRKEKKKNDRPIVAPEPVSHWRDLAIPLGVAMIAAIFMISRAFPKASTNPFDIAAFSRLPLSENGRVQPLDQVARVNLLALRERDHITAKDAGRDKRAPDLSADEWLLDVMFNPEKAATYKVFRVDWPELADKLSTSSDEKAQYFSLDDIVRHWDEFAPQIAEAHRLDEKQYTDYQRKLMGLAHQMRIYLRLGGIENGRVVRAFRVDAPVLREELGLPADQSVFSINDLAGGNRLAELPRLAGADGEPSEQSIDPFLRKEARKLIDQIGIWGGMFPAPDKRQFLQLVPPQHGEVWLMIDEAIDAANKTNTRPLPAVEVYDALHRTYAANQPKVFNELVTAYTTGLEKSRPGAIATARFEAAFNQFDPFYNCIILYVTAFILVCASWLAWRKALCRAAVALICVAWIVHTIGIIGRIYISGRPPVTNLTSASIFIAWGAILLAMCLEFFFRNTIGLLVAAAVGFCSLLVAGGLTLQEGDTLKVLQAVLDTNFWLATHVVCVTLGYATTILAGLLGLTYIFWGLFTTVWGLFTQPQADGKELSPPAMRKEDGKELSRMIYGVVCFAMFFSFVGTVLGGIWADQSWGRFWGWDSKENGAVLVVLANAILLHSRWGGLVRERGIAVLAVWGIAVTQWSFFGTNELGVGLHAYGRTEGMWFRLCLFWGLEAVVILMGLLPLRIWGSYQGTPVKPAPRTPKSPANIATAG